MLEYSNKFLNLFLKKTKIPIIIKDDYSLQEFGVDAKAVQTTGHTAGTLSIIIAKVNAFLGCNIHGFPLRLRPGLPTVAQNIDHVISSWEKIIEEGTTNLHSSHGKPLT